MNRDWYLKGILTAIALGLWVLILKPMLLPKTARAAETGQAQSAMLQGVVRSDRFELVDTEGRVRARLGMTDQRQPSLELLDEDGRTKAELSLLADSSSKLRVGRTDGANATLFASQETGELLLADASGYSQVELYQNSGGPALTMVDRTGEAKASLHVMPDGHPYLRLNFPHQTTAVELSVPPNGGPGLRLYWPLTPNSLNTRKRLELALGAGREGAAPSSSDRLSSYQEKRRAASRVRPDESAFLSMWDAKGTQVFRAP